VSVALPSGTAPPTEITQKDLDEIFPKPAVREVAFEVRFNPRFRINQELWRFQDRIANSYPLVSEEQHLQAGGKITSSFVFTNPDEQQLVRVSSENFAVSSSLYRTYEHFKDEALRLTRQFCELFEISGFQRVGLRYINQIHIQGNDVIESLQRFVNVPLRLERFRNRKITQLLTEVRLDGAGCKLTIRGALLPLPNAHLYVLDLDSFSEREDFTGLEQATDRFHHEIQVQFLEHLTAEYKAVMRGER
jgi:uncharacterized protein (TIGR04255 family)